MVAIAIICTVIYLLIRRKRKQRTPTPIEDEQYTGDAKESPEDQAPEHRTDVVEVDGSQYRHELPVKTVPAEHDGVQIHELEGRRYGELP